MMYSISLKELRKTASSEALKNSCSQAYFQSTSAFAARETLKLMEPMLSEQSSGWNSFTAASRSSKFIPKATPVEMFKIASLSVFIFDKN